MTRAHRFPGPIVRLLALGLLLVPALRAAEPTTAQIPLRTDAAAAAPPRLAYAVDLAAGGSGVILQATPDVDLAPGNYELHLQVLATPQDHLFVEAVDLHVTAGGARGDFVRKKAFAEDGRFATLRLAFRVTAETPRPAIDLRWDVGDSMVEPMGQETKQQVHKRYLARRDTAIATLKAAASQSAEGLDAGGDGELGLELDDIGGGGGRQKAGALTLRPVDATDLPTYRLLVGGLTIREVEPVTVTAISAQPDVLEGGEAGVVRVTFHNARVAAVLQPVRIACRLAGSADDTVLHEAAATFPAGETTLEFPVTAPTGPGGMLQVRATAGAAPEVILGLPVPPPRRAPTPRERQVYAHYMGCWPVASGPLRWERSQNLPETFRHESDDAAMRRGAHVRNFDLAPPALNLSAEEAADLEIRRALRIGIDGFAVDAWAGMDDARRSVDALFAAAEKHDHPFAITVCIDPMTGGDLVGTTRWLLERHGDSPKLARRDGKPLIFGYMSGFATSRYLQAPPGLDPRDLRLTPRDWHLHGQAFLTAERAIGQDIYWHFGMSYFFHDLPKNRLPEKADEQFAAVMGRYVDAIGSFIHLPNGTSVSAATRAAGAEWSGAVGMYQKENIPFEVYSPPGLEWFFGTWSGIREQDATLLQVTTWNDYGENTAIAPGWDTRYTLYDLTGYQIAWWKTGAPPKPEHDRVYLVYAKYPRGAKVWPFAEDARRERVLEVVTILTAPATVHLPGRDLSYEAPAGLHRQQFPLVAGPVAAELLRDGAVTLRLEAPEPVTDRPYRESNGFVAYSTEFARHWQADFGDTPVWHWNEYGDADGDGLPNWWEMYWFTAVRGYKPAPPRAALAEAPEVRHSRWLDLDTATYAEPDADPDADGKTNLQEYQERTDPTVNQNPQATMEPALDALDF